MTEVIKIYQQINIENNHKITVFFGDSYKDTMNELFKKEPTNEIFKDVFSEYELKIITEQNINVVFTMQRIYLDDSIETIKKKIMSEAPDEITFEEMYLYTKQITELNNTTIYENLSQKGKITITQDILLQFVANIKDFNIETLPIKDVYDFNDIISLNLTSNKQIIDIPIGKNIIT